jgi:hypothetical protein
VIHITQYLCPQRHAILAVAWDDAQMAPEDAQREFELKVELLHTTGVLRRRCEICVQDVPLHFEDSITRFRTMVEAAPHLAAEQAKQFATRQFLKAGRN